MATYTVPNSFTASTSISSSLMNANFTSVATFLNTTKINDDNIQALGVGTASINDLAVTAGKIATGAITGAAGGGKLAASVINGQTAETAKANGDEVIIYDLSATALRKMTLANLMPVSTVQILTSGTGATYTTSTGARRLRITATAGGGGGSDAANNAGSDGTDTTFSVITAAKGKGATTNMAVGVQSSGSSLGGLTGFIQEGEAGFLGICDGAGRAHGGHGGRSFIGPGGKGGQSATTTVAGSAAPANSGGGGGGGCVGFTGNAAEGQGGGAGGTVVAWINAPDATYTYTVGALGAGAANGGNGGSGLIIVEEFYQ